LWRLASPAEREAWRRGCSELTLDSAATSPQIGVLGEPGKRQRLVIIGESTVAKVPMGAESQDANRHEYENHSQVAGRFDIQPGWLLRSELLPNGTLVVERADGTHPGWDDPATIAWIKNSFVWGSEPGGVPHGDLTPWNVIRSTDGRWRVLDWELADPTLTVPPEYNVMDFVLRGAVVARAQSSHVREVLAQSGIASGMIHEYGRYRAGLANYEFDALAPGVHELLSGFVER
jgi:hypothetical protein